MTDASKCENISMGGGKRRLYLFDNLKFVLMMAVIVHHCSMPYLILSHQGWVEYLYSIIMPVTMPLFCIISGFFYKTMSFKSSFRKYLIPAIIISIVNIALSFAISSSYLIYRQMVSKMGYAMWYLYVLFIYNIITPKLQKINLAILIVIAFSINIITSQLSFISDNFQLARLCNYYFFFLIGLWLKRGGFNIIRKYSLFSILLFIVLYFGTIYANYCHRGLTWLTAFEGPCPLVYRIYTTVTCLLLSLAVLAFSPDKKMGISAMGSHTFTPYILHMILVIPLCWGVAAHFIDESWTYILCMLIVPVLTIPLFGKKASELTKKFLAYF